MLPPNPCAPSSSTLRPYLSATALTAAKSAGSPKRSTATTACGFSIPSSNVFFTAFSSDSAEILNVSISTSTNTGTAPACETISPDEKNVKSGTNTASPSLIPQAIIAIVSASVPFPHVIQCLTPTYSSSFFQILDLLAIDKVAVSRDLYHRYIDILFQHPILLFKFPNRMFISLNLYMVVFYSTINESLAPYQ